MATMGQVQPGTTATMGPGWQRYLWPWGVLGTAAVMFLSGTCCGGGVMFALPLAPAGTIPPGIPGAAGNRTIALKQFEALNDGMSYGQVVLILGREGRSITGYLSIWTNPDGSNVECMFEPPTNVMIRKAQHGLK